MIPGLTLILLCQLAGEAVAGAAGWPLPGPVLGMALLLALLLLRDAGAPVPAPFRDGRAEGAARGLLANLSLMFIPAGVGIVGRLDVLAADGAAIAATLLLSTLLALVVTALTFAAVARRLERPRGEGADG